METLTELPKRRRGRPPKYDWESLMDGQIHVLRKGRDFDTSAKSHRALAHRTATAKGWDVETRIQPAKDGVEEAVLVCFRRL